MSVYTSIEREIQDYRDKEITICAGYKFNQYKLIKRLSLYMNCFYPTGKLDSQGNYKYWFDIISPRIDSEVKNIDFDSKDIQVYSDRKKDF